MSLSKELQNSRLQVFKDLALQEKQNLKEQIKLKTEEKELNAEIKKLTLQTKNEEEQFNKEDEKFIEKIKALKNELNSVKTESDITLKYENKFLEGKEDAIKRQYQQVVDDEQTHVDTFESKIVYIFN
jgi:hypothetical protein